MLLLVHLCLSAAAEHHRLPYLLLKVAALVAVPHGCQLGRQLSSSTLLGTLTTCGSSGNTTKQQGSMTAITKPQKMFLTAADEREQAHQRDAQMHDLSSKVTHMHHAITGHRLIIKP
jgi:hypothetical protein